jgi:hypothetical protein
MPFRYSCVNPSSSPGPSRCSKASVQKTDCRYGFSSKIWFIWYMTLPIWVTSNFPSSAFEKYLAFCGLIRMCTNMGLPDLESPQSGASHGTHITQGPRNTIWVQIPTLPIWTIWKFRKFYAFFFWAINRLSILYPNGIITHLGYLNFFEFFIFYFGAFAAI